MKQGMLYRISLFASVLGLLVAGVSFAFPPIPAGFLCFYFAACWLLWIVCAFVIATNRTLLLVAMWLAIDISVLVMFLSVTAAVGDVSGSTGTELVWFICYAPMFLPCGFALSPFVGDIDAVIKSLPAPFNPAVGRVVADWLQFSFVAAIQASVIALLVPCVQVLRKAKAQ